ARRSQQQIRQTIGDDAIDLFRHRPIAAPHPSFHVCDTEPELRGDQRRRERGVHVAVDDGPIRAVLKQDGLEALHDARGLDRVRRRADVEIDLGRSQTQISKEGRRRRVVVVLACVHNDLVDAHGSRLARQRSEFREVRPRADDVKKLHTLLNTCRNASQFVSGAYCRRNVSRPRLPISRADVGSAHRARSASAIFSGAEPDAGSMTRPQSASLIVSAVSHAAGPTNSAGRPAAMIPYSFPGTDTPTNGAPREMRCASPTANASPSSSRAKYGR